MAQTDFSSLSTAQKKLWSTKVWAEGRDQSFWFQNGFMGKDTSDATKPIHYVTELTPTERGDQCVMQIVLDLQGDGVVGDNELDGKEENLINDSITIKTDQLRNGVKSKGRMSEQKTVVRFREQAQDKLSFWLANSLDTLLTLVASGLAFTNKPDRSARPLASQWPSLAFASDVSAPSTNRQFFPNGYTAVTSLTTSDTMTWNLIVGCRAKAVRKRLKPVRISGKPTYIVLMSPEQARDLKQDSNYQTNVGRAANRGDNNPLFNGAFAVIDGIILYESNKITTTLGAVSSVGKWGASSTVDGAQALLMGAQAIGFARIGDASWEESDNTDYKNKQGVAYGRIIGAIKPHFQATVDNYSSEDFSIISIYTAAKP